MGIDYSCANSKITQVHILHTCRYNKRDRAIQPCTNLNFSTDETFQRKIYLCYKHNIIVSLFAHELKGTHHIHINIMATATPSAT